MTNTNVTPGPQAPTYHQDNRHQSNIVWWDTGSHYYKATLFSGYVTGLGLSRLCIMPSTRLKNLRWPASDTTIQGPHQFSSHLFPSSLICFLLLADQQSPCGDSLPTLLDTKPQFVVASHTSCHAISISQISATKGALNQRSLQKAQYRKVSCQRETDGRATTRMWMHLMRWDQ
jgi:hypothetical protein